MEGDVNFKKLYQRMLIWSIFLFLFGGIMHCGYRLFGEWKPLAAFFPINESVFEHLKMSFYPLLIWWIVFYCENKNNSRMIKNKIIFAAFSAIACSGLLTIMIYYGYTGALGVESVVVDILTLLVSIVAGMTLAAHLLRYFNPPTWLSITSLILIAAMLVMTIVFSYVPLNLPIFIEPPK